MSIALARMRKGSVLKKFNLYQNYIDLVNPMFCYPQDQVIHITFVFQSKVDQITLVQIQNFSHYQCSKWCYILQCRQLSMKRTTFSVSFEQSDLYGGTKPGDKIWDGRKFILSSLAKVLHSPKKITCEEGMQVSLGNLKHLCNNGKAFKYIFPAISYIFHHHVPSGTL